MHLEPTIYFRLSMSEPLGGQIHSTDASILPQKMEEPEYILNEVIKPMLMALITAYQEQ